MTTPTVRPQSPTIVRNNLAVESATDRGYSPSYANDAPIRSDYLVQLMRERSFTESEIRETLALVGLATLAKTPDYIGASVTFIPQFKQNR